jgi:hypothetical protein
MFSIIPMYFWGFVPKEGINVQNTGFFSTKASFRVNGNGERSPSFRAGGKDEASLLVRGCASRVYSDRFNLSKQRELFNCEGVSLKQSGESPSSPPVVARLRRQGHVLPVGARRSLAPTGERDPGGEDERLRAAKTGILLIASG